MRRAIRSCLTRRSICRLIRHLARSRPGPHWNGSRHSMPSRAGSAAAARRNVAPSDRPGRIEMDNGSDRTLQDGDRAPLTLDNEILEEFNPLDGPLPEYIPSTWNGAHVGFRLVEAFKTLARLPVANGPRFHSGYWPASPMAWIDIVEIEREWRMNPGSESLREAVSDFASRKPKPTTIEVSRMEKAISRPAHYLAARPILCRIVLQVASLKARDLDLYDVARRLRKPAARLRRLNREALDLIAVGLRRDRVPVF